MNDFDQICQCVSKKVKFDILQQSYWYQQLKYSLYVYLYTFVLKLSMLEPIPTNGMSELFTSEHGLERFILVLMKNLSTKQDITLRDVYVLAYSFMKKKMYYRFPKTFKNKIKTTFMKFITRDPSMCYNFHLLFGKDNNIMFCKNNIAALLDLTATRAMRGEELLTVEIETILNKHNVINLLKNIYSLFMVPQRTDFSLFTEEDKKTYKEYSNTVNELRILIKDKTGFDIRGLVGFDFTDLDSRIVDVICRDGDFKMCYRAALGIKTK